MKKRYFAFFFALVILSLVNLGCGKDDTEPVTLPDTIIEEIVVENPVSEETVVEVPVIEEIKEPPVTEKTPVEETTAEETNVVNDSETVCPYWWELHDYNADQPILLSDGEFKNLTLQPGNKPNELYITWFSKSSAKGKVTFQTDGLFGSLTAKATTQGSISVPGYYRNSALVTGLESNTTYTYYLSNGSHQSPTYTYQTGDLYSTDFTFTVAGDPEIGLGDEEVLAGQRSIWKVILNRMKTQIPNSSFIITTGDQIGNPSSSVHYDYFLDNSVLYSTPLAPVVGNHDSGTGFFGDHFTLPNMSSIGHESGNDGDYWFVKGNALFMVLNNLCPLPTEVHEQFVADTIAANPDAKWRIIISHYSPVTAVERYLGTRDAVRFEYTYMGEMFDIDLFIGGHDHVYSRGYFLDRDGDPIEGQSVEYEFYNPEHPIFVTMNGSTDALLRQPDDNYPWAALSVQNGVPMLMKVHVTENSIHMTVHDADSWSVVDNFIIYKD